MQTQVTLVGWLLWVMCSRDTAADIPDDLSAFSPLSPFFRPARTNPKTDSKEVADIAAKLMNSHRMRDLEDQQIPFDLDPSAYQGHNPLDMLQLDNLAYSNQYDNLFKANSEKRSDDNAFLIQLIKHLKSNPAAYRKDSVGKRQQVSVSQLAQLLNSLKTTRGLEDGEGVKLQSLRFGRRRR